MNVKRPTPSRKVRELAGKAARDSSPAALNLGKAKLHNVRKDLLATHPLKVYFLGTLAVIEHPSLEAAVPVAWRFLILRGKRTVASTEITLEESDRGPRWTHTSYDPRLRRHMKTIERIVSDAEVRKGRFELRLLRIPGLDLNGILWLHSIGGAGDRVVQLGASPMLRAGWPYSVEQFLARLRPYAQSRRRPIPGTVRGLSANSRGPSQIGSRIEMQPATEVEPASGGGEA
jgi:hypothetical protein